MKGLDGFNFIDEAEFQLRLMYEKLSGMVQTIPNFCSFIPDTPEGYQEYLKLKREHYALSLKNRLLKDPVLQQSVEKAYPLSGGKFKVEISLPGEGERFVILSLEELELLQLPEKVKDFLRKHRNKKALLDLIKSKRVNIQVFKKEVPAMGGYFRFTLKIKGVDLYPLDLDDYEIVPSRDYLLVFNPRKSRKGSSEAFFYSVFLGGADSAPLFNLSTHEVLRVWEPILLSR